MKVITALFGAYDYIEQILEEAGILKGQFMTSDQIKNAEAPIFWRHSVTGKDASEKETYVVYQVHRVNPAKYGDGGAVIRGFVGDIYVYTRSRNIQTTLSAIENKFLENKVSFELANTGYDVSSQKHYYVFEIKAFLRETT